MRRATRRQFIAGLGAAGVSLPLILPRLARGETQAKNLRVGFVATGGQAGSHTNAAHEMGLKCVCFAEVDRSRLERRAGEGGLGEGQGLHRLAEDVRETRQGAWTWFSSPRRTTAISLLP